MDLLRAVLQPSINEEIQSVFNKYMKVRGAGMVVNADSTAIATVQPGPVVDPATQELRQLTATGTT